MTAPHLDHPGGLATARKRMFSGLSLKDRESFFLQLGTILDSGIPIKDGLNTLSARFGGKGGMILRDLSFAVETGSTLSEAMDQHPEAFDPFVRALVRTGESVGRLDENLHQAALACRRTREVRNLLLLGFIYPFFLMHAAIVIPNFVVLVTDGFEAYLWAVLVPLGVMYGLAIFIWLGHSVFRDTEVYAALRLKVPVLRKIALARFARSLASLYEGGLPLDEAVTNAGASTGNAVLDNDFRATAARIAAGAALTPSLPPGPGIPDLLRDMIATGERTGRLGETLNKAAEFYEEESDATISRTVKILPVIVYLLVAAYIASIIFRMWGGIMSDILKLT